MTLQDVCCPCCHKLLCKCAATSIVQIKCPGCKEMVLARPTIAPVIQTGPLEVAVMQGARP